MSIPEAQLDTWAHQGSITQSSSTYANVKRILENSTTPYADKNWKVFLQGSYGNDTNIYAESDVDIVIQLNNCFQHDLTSLPDAQKKLFHATHTSASYTHKDFKHDVLGVLTNAFAKDVKSGDKAIKIAATTSRRNVDVIAAIQYRRYYKFNSIADQTFDEGICFYDSANQQIANYPKQHSENLTVRHQATGSWLKPMIRILKNMRSKMVADNIIEDGCAPSYYIEGLLYNVPLEMFGGNYSDSFVKCINWIKQADRNKFLCANEQYYLLRENSAVTWRSEKCDEFLAGLVELWNEWP